MTEIAIIKQKDSPSFCLSYQQKEVKFKHPKPDISNKLRGDWSLELYDTLICVNTNSQFKQ